MNFNLKLTMVVILSSLALLFIAQNNAVVEIGFLFWRASISSALLIFFTLLTGFVLGWAIQGYVLYRKSRDEYIYMR
jgi:uncharacterized integral membrane protein